MKLPPKKREALIEAVNTIQQLLAEAYPVENTKLEISADSIDIVGEESGEFVEAATSAERAIDRIIEDQP